MFSNPFEGQLERLARTLTEQFGVRVVCQGDRAWTDGKQIALPSLPDHLDPELERMMVGYLDHEMGHVAFSDFKVAEEFMKKYPGYEGILNVVEDALIERQAMEKWPGVRANLDALFTQIRDRIAGLIQKRSPFDRFCTAIYLRLAHYKDMLGLDRELRGYDDLLDGFPKVSNTREAGELAGRMLSRWLKQHSPQAQSASQSDGEEQEAGEDGDEAQRSGGRSSEQSETPTPPNAQQNQDGESSGEASDGDPAPHQEGDPKGDEPPNGTGEQGSAGQVALVSPRVGGDTLIREALAEAIAERVGQIDTSAEYRPFTKEHDRIQEVPFADDAEVQRLVKTGIDTVRRLRRGLANALRSSEKRWWRDDQSRGVLSPRTLYRLCTDRPRVDVFRVRSVIQGRSTAVCIVLDASGSMTSKKMDVAREAMRVLLEALSDLKVPTEAFTFTTGDMFNLSEASRVTGEEAVALSQRFGRFGNLEIGLIKEYGEPLKVALKRLPNVHGTGLTPLGEAMQVGASRLMPRSESRKVMLVLTDGHAGCEGSGTAAEVHAKNVATLITTVGIELVGVGIQDESLRTVVADTIVVHEISDLPAQLCKLLGRTLQKGMVRHVG